MDCEAESLSSTWSISSSYCFNLKIGTKPLSSEDKTILVTFCDVLLRFTVCCLLYGMLLTLRYVAYFTVCCLLYGMLLTLRYVAYFTTAINSSLIVLLLLSFSVLGLLVRCRNSKGLRLRIVTVFIERGRMK